MKELSTHAARIRIQIEYIESPTLKLSVAQVRRLCDLAPEVCEAALISLVKSGFLLQAADGSFFRNAFRHHADGIVGPASLATAS